MAHAPSSEVLKTLITQLFPRMINCSAKRVEEGVSTYVYQLIDGNDVFYLRILPEVGASFAPEVRVHELLCARGVKVPEVIYFEHSNNVLQRSIMITTEVAGQHVGLAPSRDVRDVLIAAGRNLAIIDSVPIHGFGWIKRDRADVDALEAEHATYRSFASEDLNAQFSLFERVLSERTVVAVRETLERYDHYFDSGQARLAHGDFDVTHIFQQDGHFTGIIDFGEIRGGDAYYDLGHFRLHDGETLSSMVLSHLLEGYQQVMSLPPDYPQRIAFSSLLIGLRWLARMIEKFPERNFFYHPAAKSVCRDVAFLDC